ncbi:protein anon-73B1 [Haematobia irritans]|uniref:protein anon-73B1 n=1 Tax=Haematobia irritans TaxID=7368 RepID=UPI003F5017A8
MEPANSLDKYNDDDFFSTLLKWGLYFGAFFQMGCILFSIFLPYASFYHINKLDSEDSKTIGSDSQPRRLHKARKQEKKKRR